MKIKNIILISLFILILSISAVCAEDNLTDTNSDKAPQDEIINENYKISDYNYEVDIPENTNPDWIWTISVSEMPKDAQGNISISIDGAERYNQIVSVASNSLIINDLNLDWGSHDTSIKYSGDEKYNGFVKNGTFEYNFLYLEVSDEMTNNGYIGVNVVDGVKGNVKVLIDGKSVYNQKFTGENDHDEIWLDELSFGQHTYELKYSNGNYKSFTKKGTFDLTYKFYVDDLKSKYQIIYGDKIDFRVVLTDSVKSNFTVKINNRTYSFKNEEEGTEFSLSDFDIGENDVRFIYKDSKYPEKTISTKVLVLPNLFIPSTVSYNSDAISLTMPKTCEGLLNIKIDESDYETYSLENGTATIPLTNLSLGQHILTLNYSGDNEKYLPIANYSFNVIPHLNIPTKMWINGKYNITFTAPNDLNGELTLKGLVNEIIQVKNGSAIIPVSNLKEGNNRLLANYENYTWIIDVLVYNESPNWDISISYPNEILTSDWIYNWEDTLIYNLFITNLQRNLTGTFSIYHDGTLITIVNYFDEDNPDFGQIAPKFSQVGNHTITVAYSGDDYFNPVNKTHTYEMVEIQCSVNSDREVIISLPSDSTGTITINVNGTKVKSKKVTKNDDFGPSTYYFTLNTLKYGNTYEIEVIYSGNYGKFTKKTTIKIEHDYEIYIENYYGDVYGEKNTIEFSLPDDATKNAEVKIDGENYSYKKGSYSNIIDISQLKPGIHNLIITYPGDSRYTSKSANTTIEIKGEIRFSQEETSITYLTPAQIYLNLPKDSIGNLTLEILNKKTHEYEIFEKTELQNGYACLTFPSSKIGKYYFKAYFEGNYDVKPLSDSLKVTPIIKSTSNMNYGDIKNIPVQVDNESQLRMIIYVDDWEIPISEFNIDSKYNVITINKELIDKAKSIVQYNAREEIYNLYLHSEAYVDGECLYYGFGFYVKFAPKIITKNIVMQYSDGKIFTAKIYDIFGKLASDNSIVKFKIGSKTYTSKTKNGIAKVKLTQTPGKYTIKTIFQGKTIKNSLTVKQILTLKKVNVKKSAKKLTLQATLKKVNGKYLKGKKITFKFKGKKYTAKTNKKGIAKVTIKSNVLKKLKAGKKITYHATYLKDNIKKTVKVQK